MTKGSTVGCLTNRAGLGCRAGGSSPLVTRCRDGLCITVAALGAGEGLHAGSRAGRCLCHLGCVAVTKGSTVGCLTDRTGLGCCAGGSRPLMTGSSNAFSVAVAALGAGEGLHTCCRAGRSLCHLGCVAVTKGSAVGCLADRAGLSCGAGGSRPTMTRCGDGFRIAVAALGASESLHAGYGAGRCLCHLGCVAVTEGSAVGCLTDRAGLCCCAGGSSPCVTGSCNGFRIAIRTSLAGICSCAGCCAGSRFGHS